MSIEMVDICTVLAKLYPDAQYKIGVDYKSLVWLDKKIKKPSKKSIDSAIEKMRDEESRKEKRRALSQYIYAHYDAEKQAHDSYFWDSYQSVLKAMDINADKAVFTIVSQYPGVAIDVAIEKLVTGLAIDKKLQLDVSAKLRKLAKVAIRAQWKEHCIAVSSEAEKRGESPVYPSYPDFDNL